MPVHNLLLLLADDDLDDCLFFEEALEEIPMLTEIAIVHDGEQLMRYLKNMDNPIPHILFLDLNMPRKNGFDCLVEIKQVERLKHLQVIIFSTSMEQKMVDLLYTNGAQYYIHKPPEFAQLKDIIQVALTLIYHELFGATDIRRDEGDQAAGATRETPSWEVGKDLKQPDRALFILSQQYIAS
jgi:CheY-like chemotaxis protein